MIALSFAKTNYKPQIFFLRLADEIIYRGTIGMFTLICNEKNWILYCRPTPGKIRI